MKQRWEEEDLVGHWTLTGADKKLFFQRTDRGRFGLAVLLKFFQIEGRFPRYYKEVPAAALEYLGKQLAIPATLWFDYELKGRSGKRDREQIRDYLGFRPISAVDSEQLQGWLAHEVVPKDQDPNHLRLSVRKYSANPSRLRKKVRDTPEVMLYKLVHGRHPRQRPGW